MARLFGATGFSLEERVHAELCHCPLVHLAEAVVETGPHVSLAGEVLYSKESSRASGSLYPTECGGAFLQERELGTIAALLRSGIWYHQIELFQTGWLTRWVWSN